MCAMANYHTNLVYPIGHSPRTFMPALNVSTHTAHRANRSVQAPSVGESVWDFVTLYL
jgi:hypothetical protein